MKGAAGVGGNIIQVNALRKMRGIDMAVGRKIEEAVAAVTIIEAQHIATAAGAIAQVVACDDTMNH